MPLFSAPSLSINLPLSALFGTAMAGVATGSLAFGSFVDVRSFLEHVKTHKTSLIQQHFSVWWPFGRDYMVPVLVCGTVANITAYVQTSHVNFAYAAGLIALIAPYTSIILGEDIEALRKSNVKEVAATTKRFCQLHHPRLVIAATAFGLALVALAEL